MTNILASITVVRDSVHVTFYYYFSKYETFLWWFYDRYIEKDVRCHKMYRKYNTELPEFLVNRPRYFVEHYKEKLSLAEEIEKCHIKPSDTKGVFEEKSGSLSKTWYQVQFGDNDGTPPSCQCKTWQRSPLLCKHFFAIFKHLPEWKWEKLPWTYRELPFLTLDHRLLDSSCPPPSLSSSPRAPNDDNTQSYEPLQSNEPLSKKTKTVFKRKCSSSSRNPYPNEIHPSLFRKSEGKKCRLLLDKIRQLTFVVQDKEALVGLNKELSRLLNEMQQQKPLEDGLVVEGGGSKKCEEVSSKASPIEKRCKASFPKRKTKSKYSGRVGERPQCIVRRALSMYLSFRDKTPNSITQKNKSCEWSRAQAYGNQWHKTRKKQGGRIGGCMCIGQPTNGCKTK